MLVREYLSYPVPTLLFFPERRERITCGDGRVDGWTVGTCVVLDLVSFTVSSPRWTTCSMLSHAIDLFCFLNLCTERIRQVFLMMNKTRETFKQWDKDLTRSIAPLCIIIVCWLIDKVGRSVDFIKKKTAVLLYPRQTDCVIPYSVYILIHSP